jgi:putative intracellular protease/amidase
MIMFRSLRICLFALFVSLLCGRVCISACDAGEGKILVVFSGARTITLQGGGTHVTGYFLSEMAIPLKLLLDAGYEIECASPGGVEPVMDMSSDSRQFFHNEKDYIEAKRMAEMPQIRKPGKLSSYGRSELQHFDGIFLPGGHAPMADLHKDRDLGEILRYFHHEGKPTALLCHAPVALLSAREREGWIYRGYRMTAFSDNEEKEAEKSGSLGGSVSFYICDALREAGAEIQCGEMMWQSNVVKDRELITGQNPGSAEHFSEVFLGALIACKLRQKKIASWPPGEKVMKACELYNASPAPIKGNEDYRTLWIGRRKKGFPRQEFLARLTGHLNQAKAVFGLCGLKGYFIYADDDYEVAYAYWADRSSQEEAFSSRDGGEAVRDGNSFMEKVLFMEIDEWPPWLSTAGP